MTGGVETGDIIGKVVFFVSIFFHPAKIKRRDKHDNVEKNVRIIKDLFSAILIVTGGFTGQHETNGKEGLIFSCCRCEHHKYRTIFGMFFSRIILGMP